MAPLSAFRCVVLASAVVGVSACTPVEPATAGAAQASVDPVEVQANAPAPGHVVTTLQTRDHEVTVYATAAGPQFTIAAAGGTVLAERLSMDEFQSSFPGLHRRYDTAFAEDGAQLDASVTLPENAEQAGHGGGVPHAR